MGDSSEYEVREMLKRVTEECRDYFSGKDFVRDEKEMLRSLVDEILFRPLDPELLPDHFSDVYYSN